MFFEKRKKGTLEGEANKEMSQFNVELMLENLFGLEGEGKIEINEEFIVQPKQRNVESNVDSTLMLVLETITQAVEKQEVTSIFERETCVLGFQNLRIENLICNC